MFHTVSFIPHVGKMEARHRRFHFAYGSFFKKLGTQFGSRLVGMPTEVPGTENMDTSI